MTYPNGKTRQEIGEDGLTNLNPPIAYQVFFMVLSHAPSFSLNSIPATSPLLFQFRREFSVGNVELASAENDEVITVDAF